MAEILQQMDILPKVSKKVKKIKGVKKQPTTVSEWLDAKLVQPSLFTIDKEGYLVSPPIQPGDSEKRIFLEPSQIPATKDYTLEYFEKKKEALKSLEENYTAAKRHLQEVMIAYKAKQLSISDVLGANQDVHTAECALNEIAKFPRYTNIRENVMLRDLTLKRSDELPITTTVTETTYTLFPWEAFWMTPNEKILEERKETENKMSIASVIGEPVSSVNKPAITSEQRGAIIASKKKAKAKAAFVT